MKINLKALAAGTLVAIAQLAHSADLTFWSWRVEDKAFYESVARDYRKVSGDDVKFSAYKNTEYPTVLSAALASGGGPDIIHTRAYGGLSNLADAGYLLPLTSTTVPGLAAFGPSLDGARGFKPPHDKEFHGVPFATQSLGIIYNKAVLAKAGVTEMPATWDEFKALCATLKAKGVTPLANGTRDAAVLEQVFGVVGPNFYGGTDFFSAVKMGNKTFADPGFVKAIEEVVGLKQFMPANSLGIGENESRTLFSTGMTAFFITGTWNIDTVREMNAKLDFDMVPAPPLRKGGKAWVSTFADGNYSISASSKNRAAALKFINYLASRDFGQRLINELRQTSAVPGTKADDKVLAGINSKARTDGTPFVMLVGFRYQNPNGSVLLRDGLQKLIQGQGTAQQLAQDIQTGLASWHKPFQK
ncbi:extracellular solute-binding protein [Variovorax humicola]|uniref:Extracellular solute-binding protein n=1 Tax=Variovorax humicola TaxID=1769758 RepID=A0ABU8W0U9_9BURK